MFLKGISGGIFLGVWSALFYNNFWLIISSILGMN